MCCPIGYVWPSAILDNLWDGEGGHVVPVEPLNEDDAVEMEPQLSRRVLKQVCGIRATFTMSGL